MVAVNSLLYFLLTAGLSGNPEQPQDHWSSDALNGIGIGKLCPPKENLSECEAHCQKNCTNYNKPIACPRICVKGCVCDEGLVRGADGKCILPEQCPGNDTCPRGQHYVQCNAHCQWNCINYGEPIACPRICVRGCVCDRGTVRGPEGFCIKPDSCPKIESSEVEEELIDTPKSICPVNEIHSRCSANCQRNCSNWDEETFTCTKECSPGCKCKKSLVRGPDGKCIEPRECTPKEEDSVTQTGNSCPPKEHLSPCGAHCQKNCKNFGKPIACPAICVKGCVCDNGLVRGKDEKCIPHNQCPETGDSCPPKEHLSPCGAHCQKNCTNFDKPIACPTICVKGCVCDNDLVRDKDGKCVPPNQCSACPAICVKGCVCDNGLVRGKDGKCVPPKQCPETGNSCPPKEHLSPCESHCQKNCTNFDKPIACPFICVEGCVCDNGLVRDKDGKCVPPNQCPARDVCPQGEHYDQCNAHCQRNCSTWCRPLLCPLKCEHGCVCDRGTVRGPKGKCITPDKCPMTDGSFAENEVDVVGVIEETGNICAPNEHLSPCGAHCQKNCTNFEKPIACPTICVKGCVCDNDLVRGKDGKCVPPNQCPGRDVCPQGEHHDQCNAHCQRNCSTWCRPLLCPLKCEHGCVCDRGTVRGPKGSCITPDKCPMKDESFMESEEDGVGVIEAATEFCPENEEYSPCDVLCEGNCIRSEPPCIKSCVSGCKCKKGFVRGPEGKCIKKEDCRSEEYPSTKVCPESEFYDRCGALCQANCTNVGSLTPCLFICLPGCICKRDLIRGDDGKCIPKNKCPKPHSDYLASQEDSARVYGASEEEDSTRLDAVWVETQDAREEESTQAVTEFCPENEEYSPCNVLCEDNCIRSEPPCIKSCVSGCKCKKGFVRGPEGKCIKKEDCRSEEYPSRKVCPESEFYDRCGALCQANCTNVGSLTPCLFICLPGCICKRDLIRGDDGKCIPKNKCPKPHSDYAASEEDSPRIYRASEVEDSMRLDTVWVETQDAREESTQAATEFCPENEEYSPCEAPCEGNCVHSEPYCIDRCVSGCKCKKGFVRGPDGKCIKKEECKTEEFPKTKVCPESELYSKCGATCQKNCTNMRRRMACPKICIPGCICKPDLIRGDDGKCIPMNECPKPDFDDVASQEDSARIYGASDEEDLTKLDIVWIETQDEEKSTQAAGEFCPENEEYSPCKATCEGNCVHSKPYCITFCVSGCKCKKGFVRSPEGKCIKKEECITEEFPRTKVCPESEFYDRCGALCQANCTNMGSLTPCLFICLPGCICKGDLIRGDDGKCIPINECPKPHSDYVASQEDSPRIYGASEEEDSTKLDAVRVETQDAREEESTQGR